MNIFPSILLKFEWTQENESLKQQIKFAWTKKKWHWIFFVITFPKLNQC